MKRLTIETKSPPTCVLCEKRPATDNTGQYCRSCERDFTRNLQKIGAS